MLHKIYIANYTYIELIYQESYTHQYLFQLSQNKALTIHVEDAIMQYSYSGSPICCKVT